MVNVPDEVSQQVRRWAPLLLAGALAGLVASVPMAWSMMGLNRLLSVTNPTNDGTCEHLISGAMRRQERKELKRIR